MTTTTLPNRYQINGLVDTANSVLANMETLATTAGSLVSFDATTGKWNVVILKTESTTRTFTDSDIIGGIQINGSGLDEMYNSVMVEFPLRDTADETDFVRVALAAADRNPNEPDNELTIQLSQCNEPVQAEIIALQELKQNRADMIVDFTVDWTASDIEPGDVVGITNSAYGWNSKLFRIITLNRVEDGAITYSITAQQYDPLVYDTSDLSRFVRSDRNGIKAAGAIGTPIQPQVTDYQLVARPRLEIETVVPSGLVENMEFWISSNGTSYTQIDTEYPVGGGTFLPGTTVVADFDRLNGQNVYVKTRGMNKTTTGPFSPASTLLAFVPTQQTDAIGESTAVIDDSGSDILSLLGANGMLYLLNNLFGSNTGDYTNNNGTWKSLYNTMFNQNAQSTGVDLTWPDTVNGLNYAQAATTGQFTQPIIANFGSTTVNNIPSTATGPTTAYTTQFLCPASGTYKFDLLADQNSSGAVGGVNDIIGAALEVKDSSGTSILLKGSGGPGALGWQDFVLSGTVALTQNQVYTLEFLVTNNTAAGGVASFDFGWQVMAVAISDFTQFTPPYAVQYADYVAMVFEFFSGQDLDIRFRMVDPNTNAGISQWIGWPGSGYGAGSGFDVDGQIAAEWGGDNTNQGAESVVVNLAPFRGISAQIIKFECRAFWYQTASTIPVRIYADVYKGGTMSISNFKWINTGYTEKSTVATRDATITTLTQNALTTGDFIAYLNIDLVSNKTYFTTT